MIILGSKFHRKNDLMTSHHRQEIAQRHFPGTIAATVRSKSPQEFHNSAQPVLLWCKQRQE